MAKRDKSLLIWLGALVMAAGVAACGNDPDPADPACGDGTVDEGEACDDGNTTDGDGCSALCTTEGADPVCGDNTVDAGEECDDGNTTDGDGCAADCTIEEETLVCATDETLTGCNTGLDCRNAGLTGYTCEDGCCVEPVEACNDDGQTCTSDEQTTDLFLCDTEAQLCIRRCDTTTFETDQTICPTRSYCFELSEGFGTDLNDGACFPSDCDSIFDDPACTSTETSEAGTCYPVGNGASFCFGAGDGAVGADCESTGDCLSGLVCGIDATCIEPCNLDDGSVGADCGDDECMDLLGSTATNPAGLCAASCGAFSDGECAEGELCVPLFSSEGIAGWACTAAESEPVAVGEDCSADDAICVEGATCLNQGTEAMPDLVCTELCDPIDDTTGPNAGCMSDDDICQPSSVDGLGFCSEGCEPYPRMGNGNYGCSEDGATCIPFDLDLEDEWDDAQGTCIQPFGDLEYGDACPGGEDDNFTYGCTDLGLCLDVDFDANVEPRCRQLCDPFPVDGGEDECGDGEVCSRLFPLFGNDFGYCEDDLSDGMFGDACTPLFEMGQPTPCEEQGTLCLDLGGGGSCISVCRIGHDEDCPGTATCGAHGLNPEVVPTYVGLCR